MAISGPNDFIQGSNGTGGSLNDYIQQKTWLDSAQQAIYDNNQYDVNNHRLYNQATATYTTVGGTLNVKETDYLSALIEQCGNKFYYLVSPHSNTEGDGLWHAKGSRYIGKGTSPLEAVQNLLIQLSDNDGN